MKVSEVFKRQPKPKQERLVREGVMTPLCYPPDSNSIHSHHNFASTLSNYCDRCGLTAKDGLFLQPPDTGTRATEDGYSSPAPATAPTSSTSTKSTAPAQDSGMSDSATISDSSQLSLNL